MRPSIIVAGSVAQKPRHGGHTWVFLQYLLGFPRLGYDVLFLDRATPDADFGFVARVMDAFELRDSYAVLGDGGLSRADVLRRVRRSALLLNVMGFVDDDEILDAAPLSVFLDIDPGFPQMWHELGLHDAFAGHDAFVTIAENIGRPGCEIPTCGRDWLTTAQPVVLEQWPRATNGQGRFTSVASWRGRNGPVEYDGKTYGLRVHEFRKFVALPRRTGRPFELALDIHPGERRDLALLTENAWSLVDPGAVAGDPWTYRRYVAGSAAEFGVAKQMYVETRSGWLSDRTLCYLASGKPVVVEDTGLNHLYPTDAGLLTFSTLDEAEAAVEEVAGDYERHARAARALAEERFDSDRVLGRLLADLGVADG